MNETTFDWHSAYLSDVKWPILASICYLGTVVFLRANIRDNRFAKIIQPIQIGHNFILSIGSAVLAVYTAILVVKRWSQDGSTFLLCENTENITHELYLASYIYYLSKYYELLDTVLQLLKGRDPPNLFFGVYHHTLVLFMSWLWLEYVQSTQFIGLIWNCFVHTIMYYYYFLLGFTGSPPVWKRMVTTVQIVQFVFSLFVLLGYIAMRISGYECSGEYALIFNAIFNITLLYQFIGIKTRAREDSHKKK